jgi:hypothetical protein
MDTEIKRLVDKNQILKERNEYYSNEFILYEIVKASHHRELSFLPAKNEDFKKKRIRYLIAFKVDFLKKHWEMFNFDKFLLNMFNSVAILENIPVFTYNLNERKQSEKYQEFDKNYDTFVSSYDLFFDFDGKEKFEKCYQEAKDFKKILDEMKVPYLLLNSSLYGFHFRISGEYMPQNKIRELLVTLNNVVHWVKDTHKFECLDETVVDMKRLCKVPYSYECSTQCVCLPLTDKQFDNYRFDMVKYKNVMDITQTGFLKKRGLLIREHNLTLEELKSNVLKFIEMYK